jgi:hypothetical protein
MALVVAVGSSAFTSCEDSDKFRFPELTNGGYIKFVFQPDVYEGLQIVDEFLSQSIILEQILLQLVLMHFTEDPSGNVAHRMSCSLEVPLMVLLKILSPQGALLFLPFDISYSTGDMATLFNVPMKHLLLMSFLTSTITLTSGVVYNSI